MRQSGPAEDQGVAFPLVDGARSSTATGRAVLADAARAVDPALADDIAAERDWRRNYLHYVRQLVEAELHNPRGCRAVPEAGLASLHRRFEFVSGGGAVPLADALDRPTPAELRTVTVQGRGKDRRGRLAIPYRGNVLTGDGLQRQLDQWVEAGVVEPSLAEAVRLVLANPDWLDLSDRTVAVLGAGAEMGPLPSLSAWNATVVAVDLPNDELWRRIVATARQGVGRTHVPVSRPPSADTDDALAQAAGADLITQTPEVAAWLAAFDGPLTLGNYVYADGASNVRVAMAVDALTAHLAARGVDLSLAVLVTPTDVFAVPEDAVEMSRRRFAQRRRSERLVGAVSRGRLFAPNYDSVVVSDEGLRLGLADSLVPQQGPSYALAKRLQGWRARLARDRGLVSSANVAPSTRTRSVTKNRVLAAAYTGASRFGVEIFDPPTSSTLMAALLVHDLRNDKAASQPGTALDHPLELFMQGAASGGLWRTAFAPRSALPVAALLGLARGQR
jgi:hypothetical protein